MSKPALFFGIRKKPGTFSFRFVLFCFVMLLGSPARVSRRLRQTCPARHGRDTRFGIGMPWVAALYGSDAGQQRAFTIGSDGALDLPMIGHIPAAGLRKSELAQLITDRLQARSGL